MESRTEKPTVTCKPNKAAFERVCADLAEGYELTFAHIGDVFGTEFWVMLVYAFMDANEAARAIQGAINRLREGSREREAVES